MSFDLDLLDAPFTRWLELTGPLKGIKVLVKYAGPTEADKFRKILMQKGILRQTRDGLFETVEGKQSEYFLEFCKFYVSDWDGPTRGGQAAPYDPKDLAKLMGGLRTALEEITGSVTKEADFFKPSETQAN